MPRGHSKNIEHRVKEVVIRVKKENPKFSANQIINHLKRKHDNYGLVEAEVPRKRAVQKIVADNISNLKSLWESDLEKPWTIGSLDEFPLPRESLVVLLNMQSYQMERRHKPLTRREAKWVSRLYPTILELNRGKEVSDVYTWISMWVYEYSTLEQIHEIKHGVNARDFETFRLDLDMLQSKGDPEKVKIWIARPMHFELPEGIEEKNEEYYKDYKKSRTEPSPFEEPKREESEEERNIKKAIQRNVKRIDKNNIEEEKP